MITPLCWRAKGPWQSFTGPLAATSQSRQAFIGRVVRTHSHQCQDCGIASIETPMHPTGYLEIRPINNDYDEASEDRWQAVCAFCHAQNVLMHSLESNRFKLIAAPWLSQIDLNKALWPLLAALNDRHHKSYGDALLAYKTFEKQETAVGTLINCLPTTSTKPQDNIMDFLRSADLTMTDEQYEHRGRFLNGLRLLPVPAYFAEKTAFMQDEAFAHQAMLS